MKILLKTTMAGPEGVFPPGSVINAGDQEAAALIEGGFAERHNGPVEPVVAAPAAVETAEFGKNRT